MEPHQHESLFRAVIADGEVVVLNDDHGIPPGLAESIAERVAARLWAISIRSS